ncbi:MAG: protein kinase domain-containing protein [Cellvibrionaceae bacterium]
MDVEDKTKIVLPVSKYSKDAAPLATDNDDATVFVGSASNKTSNTSNFSISSESLSPNPDLERQSQLADSDVTKFSESVDPQTFSSQKPEFTSSQLSGNTDSFIIKNRFELGELLGAGGMGAVYKATDQRKLEASDKNPYVAIKVLNDDFRNHPDALISLQREARKSQTLAHPNIVNVYDFDRDGDMVFMTMEYLVGAPLDVLLRERAGSGFATDKAVEILSDISSALIYAHSHNIIHSDFKPGNIFITDNNGAKVFDFGISKAVKPSESLVSSINDNTIFDAASLGALTPAYASLEMLQGKDPAPADDVYALACVAYELFSGGHPYKKVPADKAQKDRLTPPRLKTLNRRQWRALEHALQFSRKDRTSTVSEFVDEFFGKSRLAFWLAGAAIVGVSLIGAIYAVNYTSKAIDENAIKQEMQVELEKRMLAQSIVEKREGLFRLLKLGVVTPAWESDIKAALDQYQKLAPEDVDAVAEVRQGVASNLINEAARQMELGQLNETEILLNRAQDWEASDSELSRLQASVTQRQQQIKDKVLKDKALAERRQREALSKRQRDRELQQKKDREKKIAQVMNAIEQQLRCGSGIDITGKLAASVNGLRSLDRNLAERVAPNIASDLSQCTVKLSRSSPELAQKKLAEAKTLFPTQTVLLSTRIDACNHLRVGSGGRGARFTCRDTLIDGGEGPEMVVVDSQGSRLVISKHEVSYRDLSGFCRITKSCSAKLTPSASTALSLPVSNIDISDINEYLGWLTAQSGYQYTLPNETQWRDAAKLDKEDPDRNCHLRYGAIQKGDELVGVESGRMNKQGLRHAVGNVQELVKTNGGLVALGGARSDAMSRCLVSTRKPHTGSADEVTGFRLIRSL